jgi:hypothetical protein
MWEWETTGAMRSEPQRNPRLKQLPAQIGWPDFGQALHTGTHGEYFWPTSSYEDYSGTLVKHCPEIFIGRFMAVTAIDSGIPWLTDRQRAGGWAERHGFLYSPPLNAVSDVFYQRDGHDAPGHDEWYFFSELRDLGEKQQGNPFEEANAPRPGRTMSFVGWPAATLHELDEGIGEMFWKQMKWIQPESYIADSWNCLTFVTRNRDLFDLVLDRLSKLKCQQ